MTLNFHFAQFPCIGKGMTIITSFVTSTGTDFRLISFGENRRTFDFKYLENSKHFGKYIFRAKCRSKKAEFAI